MAEAADQVMEARSRGHCSAWGTAWDQLGLTMDHLVIIIGDIPKLLHTIVV